MKTIQPKIFKGSGFYTPAYGALTYLDNVLIVTNTQGMISAVIQPTNPHYTQILANAKATHSLVLLPKNHYFLPGFVDLHVHAPQWPQAGVALDEPLNVWLDECTFPLEAKYADLAFAEKVYTDLIQQLLARGTTTAMYFVTIHQAASLLLAKLCNQLGQRGLVGKVVMDDSTMNPESYRDKSAEQALTDTETFIQNVQLLGKNSLQGIYPVVTPRFVPSCSDEVLAGLGALANQYHVHVQSHCSEGQWEHDFVQKRFNGLRDTEVLQHFNLLGKKTVLAHCNFLNEADGAIFAATGTSVAHCPISNTYFANSIFPVQKFKHQGLTIGLGTDISGGFSPSLYDNLRQAVLSAHQLEDGVDVKKASHTRGVANSRLTMTEAFYLATRGGGESLDLPIGLIEPGFACDLQIIDLQSPQNPLPVFDCFTEPEQLLHKILYLATKENIRAVYVQGQLVHTNTF